MMCNANEVIAAMMELRDDEQSRQSMRYFKTAPGEYGYGDKFLGVKTPFTRRLARKVRELPLAEVEKLLCSRWHEVRFLGLVVLVEKFERECTRSRINNPDAIECRDEILAFYLANAHCANNWDLVDTTAPHVLGRWLELPTFLGTDERAEPQLNKPYKLATLDALAASPDLWLQRMSIVSSWMTTRHGDPSYALRYAVVHLHHPHDLMHKAVGWMLREVGKQVSKDTLRGFLNEHAAQMPRTALRYAIEHMTPEERHYWLSLGKKT